MDTYWCGGRITRATKILVYEGLKLLVYEGLKLLAYEALSY
jgi:hypothetical protein